MLINLLDRTETTLLLICPPNKIALDLNKFNFFKEMLNTQEVTSPQ